MQLDAVRRWSPQLLRVPRIDSRNDCLSRPPILAEALYVRWNRLTEYGDDLLLPLNAVLEIGCDLPKPVLDDRSVPGVHDLVCLLSAQPLAVVDYLLQTGHVRPEILEYSSSVPEDCISGEERAVEWEMDAEGVRSVSRGGDHA